MNDKLEPQFKNLNLKQLSKSQELTFRIFDSQDVQIHEFKSKNVIKQIYNEFERVLKGIDPNNTFDYAAFHAHYKTIMGGKTLKRRYSIRGHRLELVGTPPLQSTENEEQSKTNYLDKLLLRSQLKSKVFYVYELYIRQPFCMDIRGIGEIKGKNFTDLQKEFSKLTGQDVKSKGEFNAYVKKHINREIKQGFEFYKNYMIVTEKLNCPPYFNIDENK